MKIALIGASGFIGSAVLAEALQRGHDVLALVTRPEKIAPALGLVVHKADVQDTAALAHELADADVAISALSGHGQGDTYEYYVRGTRSIIAAAKESRVPRLLVVGGAGSLFVAPGLQVADDPNFPPQWKASAEGGRTVLKLLREEPSLDWTFFSPAALIEPGERTGRFRLGKDDLVVDAEGVSRISVQDYAVALLDEVESPQHRRARFTIGY